jgi:eukaryotic-like serine/threonine-protein kinase
VKADPSRDLRLGLRAFESGAIDRERLLEVFQLWAAGGDQTLAAILAKSGAVDGGVAARLEAEVETDLRDVERAKGLYEDDAALPKQAESARAADTIEHVSRPSRAPGGVVGGRRFQILRPHARGGLGEVFLAFDRELNRSVALKELQARLAHDPAAQARFLLEAEITGMVAHPGVVPIYSLGRHDDGRPYYAMHLIEGETLRAAIDRFHQPTTGAPIREGREVAFRRLLRCVIDACNAVGHAHSRGVVHRDLKPENIMLGRFGETLVVDWGVAKVLPGSPAELGDVSEGAESVIDASKTQISSASGVRESRVFEKTARDPSMTQPGTLVGTPRFMSPEQASLDADRVGPPSDIYSLGVILYCVLVGRDPFPEGDLRSVLNRVRRGVFPAPRRLNRSLDPALEQICLKAMALHAVDRHGSALELANELETWLADVRYRGEQELALGQMKETLARLSLERAHNCFDRGAHPEGMLWLSRALENSPADPPDLQRVVRTSLSAWHHGPKLMERCVRHGSEVHAVAFSPDGRILATAGGDANARLWDVSTGSPLCSPMKHGGTVRAVAFSPNGGQVATAGEDHEIRRWDARTGAPIGDPIQNGAPVDGLIFNRDGSRMATSGAGACFLWSCPNGSSVPLHDRSVGRVHVVAFKSDGSALVAAFDDGVCLFDAATGERLGALLAHESPVRILEFDATGERLLTSTCDGIAQLWDLNLRIPVVTISGQGKARCLAFRPDGEMFAAAFEDGTARLWESAGGRPVGEPFDHRSRVDCLAFRPDGAIVATGGSDGLVRLWCAFTGLPIGPPLEQGGELRTMVFSQDGRRLATGGTDATVRCWSTPAPLDADVERISAWVRVTTDLDFDSGDAIKRMDGSTSWELRRRLTELGGSPLK